MSENSRLHHHDDDRILSFAQWCQLNGISLATGRRIIKSGNGPVVVRMSPRRIGISIRSNREWQASRVQGLRPAEA
jgi:hypothetical protein